MMGPFAFQGAKGQAPLNTRRVSVTVKLLAQQGAAVYDGRQPFTERIYY
jgi:hypothetical protein